MNKLFAILAVAGLALTATAATAAYAQTVTTTTQAPAATTVTTTAVAAAPAVRELKDGTRIEVAADNSVSVINADGSKTPAPDGAHTLKDGTTITTKDGKKVAE